MAEIPDSKIIVNVCCSNCNHESEINLPLVQVFNYLQKKIPSTKGPIESIYAMIERKKALKSQIECAPY